MHELSVALSLVDIACEEMRRLSTGRVQSVRLRLGPLAGVAKDALLFSFDVATAGTPLEGARLHIEDVPITAWCDACAAEQPLVSAARRRCPVCNAVTPQVLHGTELELVGLEMTDV